MNTGSTGLNGVSVGRGALNYAPLAGAAAAAPVKEFLISTGTMALTETTFGLPLAYQQTNRISVVVRNGSGISIQVGYATRNTISPPSNWNTTQTVPAGGDWVGDPNRGDPIWMRDPNGTAPVVSYKIELGV